MSDQNEKRKNSQVEWEFSFGKLADQISDVFRGQGQAAEVKTGRFTETLGGATSAQVRIDFSVGETYIRPLTASDNLIEADLRYVGEINFAATPDAQTGRKSVLLSQARGMNGWFGNVLSWIGSNRDLRWDVGLTTQIPLELEVHNGAGQCDFDLSALKLTSLNVAGGACEVTLALPGGTYSAQIDSGVGQSNIRVAPGATVDLTVKAGTGEINLDVAANSSATVRINGGVGATNIRVPAGAAVRINARTGLGDLRVAPSIPRVQGGDDEFISKSGVWQSPDFETAAQKIDITFNGGVGSFDVRLLDVV